jgi:hypothetical protein
MVFFAQNLSDGIATASDLLEQETVLVKNKYSFNFKEHTIYQWYQWSKYTVHSF